MPCLSEVDESANAMICIQLSRSIIFEFNHIPEKYPKHTFPFISYVATATIIALGLVIKQPRLGSTDLAFVSLAAEILKRFCTQTWVSGRIIRAVARIDQVSKLALGRGIGPKGHLPDPSNQNPNDASQVISNEGSGSDVERQSNLSDPNLPVHPIRSPTHHIFAHQEHQVEPSDSQQVPSNMMLGTDFSTAAGWASDSLTMTDFDFEEGLRHHDELNGGWPWLSDFWDTGISMHWQGPDEYGEHSLPPRTLFNSLGSIPLDTIDAEALEFGRGDMLTSNPPIGDESRTSQSNFRTGL